MNRFPREAVMEILCDGLTRGDTVIALERLLHGVPNTRECTSCLGTGECQGGDACHRDIIHDCPICKGTGIVCPTCGGIELTFPGNCPENNNGPHRGGCGCALVEPCLDGKEKTLHQKILAQIPDEVRLRVRKEGEQRKGRETVRWQNYPNEMGSSKVFKLRPSTFDFPDRRKED